MNRINIYYSDHVYRWSEHEKQNHYLLTAQTLPPFKETGYHRSRHRARLPYRAIQTMRKKRLQMHAEQRTWPQVLSDSQHLWQQAGCHLRTHRRSTQCQKTPIKLPTVAKNYQRNLRYQQGASQKKRSLLSIEYEKRSYLRKHYRYSGCCNACCKYDPGIYRINPKHVISQGGLQ
jgi:hypothetical protein